MEYTIRWSNKRQIKEWFRQEPTKFAQEANRSLKKSMIYLEGRTRKTIKSKKLVYRGHMLRSVTWNVRNLVGEVAVNAKYASAQEFGTKPFKPSYSALRRWGRIKYHSEAIGMAVAHKIERMGIKPKYFLKYSIDRSKKKMLDLISRGISNHFSE